MPRRPAAKAAAPVVVLALAAALAAPVAAPRPAGAAEPTLRIEAEPQTLVEVAARDLEGVNPAKCTLYHGGESTPVPFHVRGDGSLVFFADARPRHSRTATFVLKPVASAHANDEIAVRRLLVERNDHYEPLVVREARLLDSGADWFYFGPARKDATYEFEANPLEKVSTVRVILQGGSRATKAHEATVSVAGHSQVARWTGPSPHLVTLERVPIPKAPVHKLTIESASPVLLDRIELEGRFHPPASRGRVTRIAPEDLRAATNRADYVVVALDPLADAVKPLLAHREAQGLKTKLVRFRDVLDVFAAGQFTPRALADFVRCTQETWAKPAPRYFLLVGDASYDVDWHFPAGETLPTTLVDTIENGATASDHAFVCDDKGVPFAAIGRFPARTPTVVTDLVRRTIAYETESEPGPWRRRLSFVAGEGRFGAVADAAIEGIFVEILSKLVPYAYDVNMTYANPTSPYCYVPDKLTEKVVERLNEGCLILNYIGHGHRDGFDNLHLGRRRYPIFMRSDVPDVACAKRAPIVIVTACWTGAFDYVEAEEPVGERLFEHPGGPIAVIAGTRITHPVGNSILSKDLVGAFFGEDARRARLGDVLSTAKRDVLSKRDEYRDLMDVIALPFIGGSVSTLNRINRDTLHHYVLLGDPALVPALPMADAKVEVGGAAVSGRPLVVRGEAPGIETGRALVTLEVQRKTIRGDTQPVDLAKPGAAETVLENYAVANDKVCARAEVPVVGGRFEATLALPDDLLPVRHYVKAYCWSDGSRRDAAGSLEVRVEVGDEESE